MVVCPTAGKRTRPLPTWLGGLRRPAASDAGGLFGGRYASGGKRQKQSNMIEVLGLPSQQAGAARAGKGQGATRRGGGAGKARRLTGAGNTAVKVKDEVEVKMSLRAKQTKKGFYNERNLAHLAWCKGRGTRLDPFVID